MKVWLAVIVALMSFTVEGTGEVLVGWCDETGPGEYREHVADYDKCLGFLSRVVEANELLSSYEMNSVAHSEREHTFFCSSSVDVEQLRQIFLQWSRTESGLGGVAKGNAAVGAFRHFWPCH